MPPVVEKYWGLFPTVLFLCHDDTHSMHFILSLKHMPEMQQKKLVELMNHCGAEISLNVEDATNHSAIIVDHNEIVNYKAPAFTVKYIENCLEKLKLQDISDFRQQVTQHIGKDVECMDVVYFRSEGWNSVLSEAEQFWFEERIYSDTSLDLGEPQASSSCVDILGLINSRFETEEHNGVSQPKEILPKKNYEDSLSNDEDSDVQEINSELNFHKIDRGAIEKQKYNTIDKQKPENEKKIKENRNLQSKALYSKSKNGTTINSDNITRGNRKQREINSKSTTGPSKKWAFLDEFQPNSSDEEVPPEEADKKIEKKFFDFEGANEDLCNPNKDKKHSRLPYSYDEQSKILKYIIDHNEYSRIKGRELWMVIERRKICPNRTWQSMKEHFVKKILYSLESFDFLTETNKMKLKNTV